VRRFIFVILGLLFSSNIICWYALDTLLARLGAPGGARTALAVFIALQMLGLVIMFGARAFGFQPGTGLGRPLLSLLMIWNMLLAMPAAVISVAWLLVWLAISGLGTSHELSAPARTVGLLVAGLPFAVALISTVVSVWQLNHFRVQRLTLEIPRLPEALRGFTIVHLSDLHIGKLTRGKVLDDIVAETNRLDADLVLLTGDLINFSLEDLPTAIALLRRMKSRHGLYFCEGNHDLIEDEARFEVQTKASNVGLLLHETATVMVKGQVVQVLGLRWDDAMRQRGKTAGATPYEPIRDMLAKGTPGAFSILLAHHPDAFDAAAEAGIPLTLAGHTHGGQLMLTPTIGFGPWLYRYWSGLYQKGASQLIVSNGTGNWFPLRLNTPAEIIHLTLAPGPEV
jgi:predicted MPP superfamily phosphohydrolase